MRILFSPSAPNDMKERKRLDRGTIKWKIQVRVNTQGKKNQIFMLEMVEKGNEIGHWQKFLSKNYL